MKHIYVHVPFCQEICAYCDFFRVKCNDGLIDKWLAGLRMELDQYRCYETHHVDTIYIGGGTPSALNLKQLTQLLEMLLPFAKYCKEYSFEANPESLSKDKIAILSMYGVNRISLGVQTLDEKILDLIHRKHRPSDVLEVINNLHEANINNISIDMMYGLPMQTKEMWVTHLEEVAKWPITHVSMYALTIEEHSEFGRQHQELIDNEMEGEMYELGVTTLERNGLMQYEVSNFARNEQYSRHNISYWLVDDYLGLGPGAHGSLDDVRYENTENINDYINGKFISKQESIEFKERMFEVIMLGLRMKQGISLNAFQMRFHISLMDVYQGAVQQNIKHGMLELVDGNLRTTKKGMQFLHTLLMDFMEDR